MKLRAFVVSDSAVIDRRTNALSIFNIHGEITAESFPVAIPRLTIIAVVERREDEEERPDLVLRIKQGNDRLFEQRFSVDFQGKEVARHIIELRGLVVSRPDPLVIQLLRNSRQIAVYRIIMKAVPEGKSLPG